MCLYILSLSAREPRSRNAKWKACQMVFLQGSLLPISICKNPKNKLQVSHIHRALEMMTNSLDLVAVYAVCAVIPSILPK